MVKKSVTLKELLSTKSGKRMLGKFIEDHFVALPNPINKAGYQLVYREKTV